MALFGLQRFERICLVAFLLCAATGLWFLALALTGSSATVSSAAASAPRRYREFSHRVKAHQKQCSECHKFPTGNWKQVRQGEAAFPDITEYPTHESCLQCHHEQFFNGRPPAICSICHVSPSPRNSARQPFPNPVEIFEKSAKGRSATSDFRVGFSHQKHADALGQNSSLRGATAAAHARPQESTCATCHKLYQPEGDSGKEFVVEPPASNGENFWLKKGAFQTAPRSHQTCFECHTKGGADIPPYANNCAACHKLSPAATEALDFDPKIASKMSNDDRIMLYRWRRRDSSGTFRHEIHSETKCTACHSLAKMDTADVRTLKIPVMSCGGEGCHVTATTDEGGALNYEIDQRAADAKFQCAKCHLTLGKKPVPPSHTAAITALKGK